MGLFPGEQCVSCTPIDMGLFPMALLTSMKAHIDLSDLWNSRPLCLHSMPGQKPSPMGMCVFIILPVTPYVWQHKEERGTEQTVS
jgi:hypothetical protein